jgi:RNA polymerase sigma-70 factor, ECF subfamily
MTRHPVSSDVEVAVLEALDQGDLNRAATAAIRGYGVAVLTYLRSVLRDEATAGDAFSQWAESFWRGLGGFRREASVRSWAFRLAWNCALHVREEAWHRKGRRFEAGEASALADSIRTRTAVDMERRRRALDELRRELSAEDETLLVLRIDQELSWKEIADVLTREEGAAVDPNALQKRYERLRERLRHMAAERGLL